MKRRDVLQLASAGAISCALPNVAGCAPAPQIALRPWQGPDPDLNDPRLVALAFAVLAPNAHNTQPWQVDLSRPAELDLYVDPSRLLPATDPVQRQIHLSQGTFLEHLELAAREHGYSTEISYFPRGEYGPHELRELPIARVRFEHQPSVVKDPLFAQIRQRQTNRRVYESSRALSAAQCAALTAAISSDLGSLRVVCEEPLRSRLSALCGEAMRVEVSSRTRNRETAKWFRFSSDEIDEKRDGFGVAQNGVAGFSRWVAESFLLSREAAEDPAGSFAAKAVAMARDGGRSAAAFAVLGCAGNTRLHQVKVGRAYARFALTACALGLAVQPMSQATEEYADMNAARRELQRLLQSPAEAPVQMLVRVGFAEPVPHAPRRDVRSLLRPA